MNAPLDNLLAQIRACRICVENPIGKALPHEPRPVIAASSSARILIASQAPGTKVHQSGRPFTDASGDRLRQWLGVSNEEFYDPGKFAIVPMGFCFPGQDYGPDAADRPGAHHRHLCPELAHGGRSAWLAQPNGDELAHRLGRFPGPQDAASAASLLAQHRLAQAQSVVRNGFAAFPAGANPLPHRLSYAQFLPPLSGKRQNFFLVKDDFSSDHR